MISSLLHLVGLGPRVYYTLTNFRGGGAKAPLATPLNTPMHVVYSYNDINFTYLYMRTNYLRPLANIVDILWSRPVWRGGGGGGATPN